MKSIYRHKTSGDIFAIQTDDSGRVVAACGPLFGKDFDPKYLDYDSYWNMELQAKLTDFEQITPDDYLALLHKYGFYAQPSQRYLF
jgi:hypothetical protein